MNKPRKIVKVIPRIQGPGLPGSRMSKSQPPVQRGIRNTNVQEPIIITEQLYINNEDYHNSLSPQNKKKFIALLQKESERRFAIAQRTGRPVINMVFFGHWGWVFSNMVEIYKKQLQDQYDIISSVYPIAGSYAYQYWRTSNSIAKSYNGNHFLEKSVQMVHDSPYDIKRSGSKSRIHNMHKFATIMCTSKEQYDYYSKNAHRRKYTQFIYNPLGIKSEIQTKSTINRSGKIKIGFIGRSYGDGVKQESKLVDISQHLDPSKFEFIVLSPNIQKIEQTLRSKGFAVKNLSSGKFEDLYKSIDVTCILSRYEGTPLPLIESMKYGHTVISSRVGEAPVLLDDSYLTDNARDISIILNNLYENRSILEENRIENSEAVKHLTWDRFIKKSVEVWEQINT